MTGGRESRFVAAIKRMVRARVAEHLEGNPEALERVRSLGLVDDDLVDGIAAGTVDVDRLVAQLRNRVKELAASVREHPSLLEDLDIRPIEVLGATDRPRLTGGSTTRCTVVFTDLEGFTPYTVAEGDLIAARVLDEHYRVVDRLVRSRGGRVWKRLGDGHMLSFPSPESAVMCSLEMIEASPADLLLRSGAHLGDVVEMRGDLAGSTVNLASRVAGAAAGGEALVTVPVRDEAGAVQGVVFGVEHPETLKGFADPVPLVPVVRLG